MIKKEIKQSPKFLNIKPKCHIILYRYDIFSEYWNYSHDGVNFDNVRLKQ